jgi:hypothetical protein
VVDGAGGFGAAGHGRDEQWGAQGLAKPGDVRVHLGQIELGQRLVDEAQALQARRQAGAHVFFQIYADVIGLAGRGARNFSHAVGFLLAERLASALSGAIVPAG